MYVCVCMYRVLDVIGIIHLHFRSLYYTALFFKLKSIFYKNNEAEIYEYFKNKPKAEIILKKI